MRQIAANAAATAGLLIFAYVIKQSHRQHIESRNHSVRKRSPEILIDDEPSYDSYDFYDSIEDLNQLNETSLENILAGLSSDVQIKQSLLKENKVARNEKINYNQAHRFHKLMTKTFDDRLNEAWSVLSSVPPQEGSCSANFKLSGKCSVEECKQMENNAECIDYNNPVFSEKFLPPSGQATGRDVFNADRGTAVFYYVAPRAIPLNVETSDQHVTVYRNYLEGFYRLQTNHFQRNMVFSYVIWQNGAIAAPKNLKYQGSVPNNRMNRFWKNPGSLTYQPILSRSLEAFADTVLGSRVHSSADNTVPDARNCYVLWFHQDMPRDISKFVSGGLRPSGYGGDEKSFETLNRCTYAHAWVMPDFDGQRNDMPRKRDMVRRATAAMMDSYYVAVDDNFSGRFILNSYDEINSDDFHNRVLNYFYAAKNRRLCQATGKRHAKVVEEEAEAVELGEVYEPTEVPIPYEPLDLMEDLYPDSIGDYGDNYEYVPGDLLSAEELGDVIVEPTTRAYTPNVCCGHGFNSKSFDDHFKTCCQNIESDVLGLNPHIVSEAGSTCTDQ